MIERLFFFYLYFTHLFGFRSSLGKWTLSRDNISKIQLSLEDGNFELLSFFRYPRPYLQQRSVSPKKQDNGKHGNFERFVQRQYTLAEKCFSRIVMYIPPMSDSSLWLLSTVLDFWEIIILKSAPAFYLI